MTPSTVRTRLHWIGCGLVVSICCPAFAQQQSAVVSRQVVESKPPSITYPRSRRSTSWVTMPRGVRVAVDKGVEWKGVKVYLSLTWNLVAVDKQGKAIWGSHVSAFWDTVGFERIEAPPESGKEIWAVALTSSRKEKFVEYYDLKTGKKLRTEGGGGDPKGRKSKLRKVWSGDKSNVDEPMSILVSSAKQWEAVRSRLFSGVPKTPTAEDKIDFEKEAVLVLSSGKTSNCRGISAKFVYEDDERMLVRLHYHTYQSFGNTPSTWPYGIIIVPRRDKPYIVERNRQSLIGGPALWKEFKRFELK